jgi:hypothetical protein
MDNRLLCVIATCSALLSVSVHSAPSFDPIDPTKMVLESTAVLNGSMEFQVYTHPIGAPGSNKYVRPDAPADHPFKTGLIVPRNPPGDASLRVAEYFDGYTARSGVFPTADFGAPGYIVIKTHHGHYPNLNAYTDASGISPFDWGGFAKGDSNRWRFGVGFGKVNELMSSSVDWDAGLRLDGKSWGGTTAILQSLLLKDPAVQSSVTIVNSSIPNTLFVRKDTTPGDNINQNGMYYLDPAAVKLAWDDPTNVETADIIANADALKGIYYGVFGNSQDVVTKFDLEFFTLFCEARKIACMGAWMAGDHGQPDTGLVKNYNRSTAIGLPAFLPPSYGPSGPFSGPDSDSRLDKVLPVFTNSTANFFSSVPGDPGFLRGHYNLGLEWNSATQPIPTTKKLVLPIRYRRHTGFGAGSVYKYGREVGPDTNKVNWIPDQPDRVSFDITLRRTGKFSLPLGKEISYTLPAQGGNPTQSGSATVTAADEITITGLTLDTSTAYTNLILRFKPAL